jgi:enamine deaminase RidA (YjgF/YER057c/UK114 family)
VRSLLPEGWLPPRGYANGVVASGRTMWVAGQVGWDPRTARFASDDFVAQAAQALRNVVDVLEAGGARPSDLVRMTWYVTDREAYLAETRALGTAYREIVGPHYPAMTLVVVAGLLEPRALVEIEATAVIADP